MADDLDTAAAVSAYLGQRPDQAQLGAQARYSVSHAIDAKPDFEAELRDVARRTGVPVDTVRAFPDQLKREANLQRFDFDAMAAQFPRTAAYLADPENAKLAHDDVENLSGVERVLGFLGRSGKALASSVPATNAGLWGVGQAAVETVSPLLDPLAGTILPENPLRRVAAGMAEQRQVAGGMAKRWLPPSEGAVEGGYYSGLQSLGQNLLTLPLALTGGANVGLSAMVAPVGGQAYGQARDKGISVPGSLGFGASQAAVEWATEKIPLSRLLGDVKAGAPLLKTLVRQGIAEVPGEQVATVLQDLNEWAVLNPDKPFSDYLKERPSSAAQTLVATLVGVGGQVSVVRGLDAVVNRAQRREQAAKDAEQTALAFDQLNQLAAASKVRGRDSQSFDAFVKAASEDGPVADVFISPEALAQSGALEQVAAASPSVAQQFAAARETGADIRIPVAEYAANIAGEDFAQSLVEHLKTDPQGFSKAEADTYLKEHATELQAEVEQVLSEREGDATFKASRDAVQADVLAQLERANRFTSDVNAPYATLMANFYAVQAARLGVTPEQFAQQYPVRIVAQSPLQGEALAQEVWKSLADVRAAWDASGISNSLSERDGVISLSKIVVPAGARGAGSGTSAMRMLTDYADATGQRIELSPSTDFGASSRARLVKFYKSLGFIENKGRAKDFSTRETMFREPKAASFEQGQRGTFTPGSNTIALLKGADLSTFLHEAGHFFLEVQADLAARILAQRSEGASLTPGEQQIVDDMNRLLEWFHVKPSEGADALTTWHRMSLEEKRQFHEQFARGFEAYLFEGKAPSVELQGIFGRFRAWMLNVYRQLKALNVDLSDDVRGVMDRMLATADQIQAAEAAQSLGMMFKTPEEAAQFGVEWQAYHALGLQATQEAVTTLEARSLRDMQWLSNAKARELKKLQKRAEGLRRETEREVRAEVMSQPIYRAWSFLTGKGEADQQVPAEARSKASKTLDVSRDTLFTAIAKLGGLNRDAAVGEWGVDPKDKFESGVFGTPVVRAEGGLSIDAMAERLLEDGYLTPDENGRHDTAELFDKFDAERRGQPQYSFWGVQAQAAARSADETIAALPLEQQFFGKLRTEDLRRMYGTADDALWRKLSALGMTSDARGIDPDILAETFGFSSGDELARKLAEAQAPSEVVEGLTDQRMLERYGDLTSPDALGRAADQAVHNEMRARVLANELGALQKALNARQSAGTDSKGRPRSVAILPSAAKQFAADMVARLKVRDLSTAPYRAAEARAGKEAEKALKAGELDRAALAKRNQLINNAAVSAAHAAREEVDKAIDYFKRLGSAATRKSIDADYTDQIEALLERYDLRRGQSLKAIDKRKSLAVWVESQRDMGIEPEIPAELLDGAQRKSYKDMTVEELRGLRDTVKQIEHLGRLKNKLLTSRDKRQFEAIRDDIAVSILENANGRTAETRTPTTNAGRWFQAVKAFGAAHIKAATWARILDGGKDGGPVWEHFMRAANARADQETTMRAEATQRLSEILAPVLKGGRMGGKGVFFPSINRSLNRESVLAIALNTGNASNLQRLLGGEGWTLPQIAPVLDALSAQEWQAVQGVWDHFESYRPLIAAKERRVFGKEPVWIEPHPVVTKHGTLRGGYYPVKYDPLASSRAEEHADAEAARQQLKGAYGAATTRRSFTKSRVDEVNDRPLMYTLSGLYGGVNEVIHDLAWHEWLIDTNRLLRSDKIDRAIRGTYGPDAVHQFKTWRDAIAEGDGRSQESLDRALGRLRQGVSVAGLGFNVMSAAMQPLGITQSIVRVGAGWIGKGVMQYTAAPIAKTREVNAKSEFMRNRMRTRFRELNELRNRVQDQTALRERINVSAYVLMMRAQQVVDVPTWLGAYEKAIAAGNDEARAIDLADQAVIDAQGGGQTKDLAAIERGGPAQKLFTVFYSFMNTALNLGVAQGMTNHNAAKTAVDMALLYVVPAVLGSLLKDALTPGDAGDDEDLFKKLLIAQAEFLFGLVALGREFAGVAKVVAGEGGGINNYSGPAGLRVIPDAIKAAQQAAQGEFDDAFRKSAVNIVGDLFALPAAQINRSVTGAQALAEGETENPAALVFGFQRPK